MPRRALKLVMGKRSHIAKLSLGTPVVRAAFD